ncbi:MAG: ParB/RepB/Spo0J family partition protein [Thermosynechococcaceae cyanobacterium MS004]|nr:ParB/RepB/Spo0J family partition protein [Thermosynechococcaceae cyanobacterium MS004]
MAKSPFAGVKSSAIRTQIELGSSSSLLDIEQITDRPSGDTRPLNEGHIKALAESIEALGLIQPITVDSKGHLLAGGHRRAAIKFLKETNFEAFEKHFSAGIPVHRYDFDADTEPELALAIEATENEKRRDYTAAEVRELAQRLKTAGFHHTRGRAKAGQKSLTPTLAVIVGKSIRTVERYLAGSSELNPTDDGFDRQLNKTLNLLRKLQSIQPVTTKQSSLVKELPQIIERIEQALE